ncbi:MAG TPA: protein-L-isoaspartate O-methyltransferase [Methylotenera sp.]|nr:protein-L-isoaspartate O-methyltransferase [Methylotenera sp.]
MTQTVTHAVSNASAGFNASEARFNMIEQQIRTWDVLDPVVLAVLDKVPRENFVAESQKGLAFADIELPIGNGHTMLSPKVEGRILQAVGVKNTDKVLVVGTGSGYLTALLATLAHHVHAVEIHPELSTMAQARLQNQNIHNVTLHVADGANGYAAEAPYDVIVFTGSLPLRPLAAEKMLNVGGRLFAVIGEMPIMEATLTQRISADAFRHETIFETCLQPLDNAPQAEKFEF